MNENKENLIKSISEYYFTIFLSLSGIQLTVFLLCLILKKSILILHITPITLLWVLYLAFKDSIPKQKEKDLSFLLLKIDTLIFMIALVNNGILSALNAVAQNSPFIFKESSMVLILVDVMIVLVTLALVMNETFKEKMNVLHETDTSKLINKEANDVQIKPGDAVLGTDLKTGKPVVLPLKDRYLHMLIIGPTGSGKTSQSIIPMIHRDMQNLEIGITVLEPKGDLAEKIFAMARHYNREVLYFNPILPDSPYFNPLYGDENDVLENMATTFKMLNPDSSQFFLDMNETTIKRAIKVIKRIKGDDATLLDLETILNNTANQGRKMINDFQKLTPENPSIARENADIAQWFLDDYYSGIKGDRGCTKTFEHCSGLRSQVAKLTSNKYLRRVLNPPPGESKNGINFDDALERGIVITMATAQGKLRDLGRYLGYFIILQLQASVFRRPGNEDTRRGNMLFIDEFQVYTTPGFADMLTQGRSYRVASHLATQARDQIAMGGGKDGKNFVTVVDVNARNKIVYPGSFSDAEFYSKQFGEVVEKETKQTRAYSAFAGGKGIFADKISESTSEVRKVRITPTDIVYRKFGEITYAILQNDTLQTPGFSKIEYIPRELHELLNKMVAEYNAEQEAKRPGTLDDINTNKAKKEFDSSEDLIREKDGNDNVVIADIMGEDGEEDFDLDSMYRKDNSLGDNDESEDSSYSYDVNNTQTDSDAIDINISIMDDDDDDDI